MNVFPGSACGLGIDGAEFNEGSPNNHLSPHNVDNYTQALILYQIWAHFLNPLDAIHDDLD